MIYDNLFYSCDNKMVSLQGYIISEKYDSKLKAQEKDIIISLGYKILQAQDIVQAVNDLTEPLIRSNINHIEEIALMGLAWFHITQKYKSLEETVNEILPGRLQPTRILSELMVGSDDLIIAFKFTEKEYPHDSFYNALNPKAIIYFSLNEFLEKMKISKFTSTEDELLTFLKGEILDTK